MSFLLHSGAAGKGYPIKPGHFYEAAVALERVAGKLKQEPEDGSKVYG